MPWGWPGVGLPNAAWRVEEVLLTLEREWIRIRGACQWGWGALQHG